MTISKKFPALGLAVLALAFALGCGPMAQDEAKSRVTNILQVLKEEGPTASGKAQQAVSMWAQGKLLILDDIELGNASNRFTVFLQKKDLYRKISSYEIVGAKAEGDGSIVDVKIDGSSCSLRVEPGKDISWVR